LLVIFENEGVPIESRFAVDIAVLSAEEDKLHGTTRATGRPNAAMAESNHYSGREDLSFSGTRKGTDVMWRSALSKIHELAKREKKVNRRTAGNILGLALKDRNNHRASREDADSLACCHVSSWNDHRWNSPHPCP